MLSSQLQAEAPVIRMHNKMQAEIADLEANCRSTQQNRIDYAEIKRVQEELATKGFI